MWKHLDIYQQLYHATAGVNLSLKGHFSDYSTKYISVYKHVRNKRHFVFETILKNEKQPIICVTRNSIHIYTIC